jgi:serine/threonine protein kinase
MWALGVITYILLGGYPPFHDDRNQNMLFKKIKKGNAFVIISCFLIPMSWTAEYQFHDEYWNHISEEAKDLIRHLLLKDPVERLTVDQALSHSWVSVNILYIIRDIHMLL